MLDVLVQALQCYACVGTTAEECVKGVTNATCAADSGFDTCFVARSVVTLAQTGDVVTLLDKQCGISSFCNKLCAVITAKQQGKGNTVRSCNSTCCDTNFCNKMNLAPPTPTPEATSSPRPDLNITSTLSPETTAEPFRCGADNHPMGEVIFGGLAASAFYAMMR